MTDPPLQPAADVLLVDDDPADVELIVRSFAAGHDDRRIEIARDGQEALALLRGRAAPPRLILLALDLPKVHGLEVLRAVRDDPRLAPAPVVILTAADDARELEQCYRLGANSCVQKPVDFTEFSAAIRRVAEYWLDLNRSVSRTRYDD